MVEVPMATCACGRQFVALNPRPCWNCIEQASHEETGLSAEWSWPAIDRVLANGGAFRS